MTATILTGDALEVLRTLEAESVQCCVTSPPYWGLRDYGVIGQLGLESTPEEYVARMVEVFREVRRVLRPDGVLWLNLGDSYAGSWGAQSREHAGKHGPNVSALSANQVKAAQRRTHTGSMERTPGLKPKDLVGIPWRVAFALQADGWWLRSDVIWSKPNPMPESVRDRPTRAHEYLFLLTKAESYFYDADAIAEPAVTDPGARDGVTAFCGQETLRPRGRKNEQTFDRRRAGFNDRWDAAEAAGGAAPTRNKRSVWTIASQPFPGSHFAVMPEALVDPCVLAGSKLGDVVLDPFAGSGTVGVVALKRGRSFLGIELNPAYAAMARERIASDAPLLNRVLP